jgi:hypothetical protein
MVDVAQVVPGELLHVIAGRLTLRGQVEQRFCFFKSYAKRLRPSDK